MSHWKSPFDIKSLDWTDQDYCDRNFVKSSTVRQTVWQTKVWNLVFRRATLLTDCLKLLNRTTGLVLMWQHQTTCQYIFGNLKLSIQLIIPAERQLFLRCSPFPGQGSIRRKNRPLQPESLLWRLCTDQLEVANFTSSKLEAFWLNLAAPYGVWHVSPHSAASVDEIRPQSFRVSLDVHLDGLNDLTRSDLLALSWKFQVEVQNSSLKWSWSTTKKFQINRDKLSLITCS